MTDFEKLGLFYLGREVDPATRVRRDLPLLGKVGREAQDVTRASDNVSALTQQWHDLQAALAADLQAVAAEWDLSTAPLERVLAKPKRVASAIVSLVELGPRPIASRLDRDRDRDVAGAAGVA